MHSECIITQCRDLMILFHSCLQALRNLRQVALDLPPASQWKEKALIPFLPPATLWLAASGIVPWSCSIRVRFGLARIVAAGFFIKTTRKPFQRYHCVRQHLVNKDPTWCQGMRYHLPYNISSVLERFEGMAPRLFIQCLGQQVSVPKCSL